MNSQEHTSPPEKSWSTPAAKALLLLAFVGLSLLLFAEALEPDRLLTLKDAGHLYLALKTRTAEAFHNGRLPLWEERIGCGLPLLAEPIAQVLYPGNLLCLLVSPSQCLKYLALLHFVLAGLATMLLAREFEVPQAGAALGGLIFLASGPVISHHWSPPWSAGLPWFLLAMTYSRRLAHGRGTWRSVAVLSFSLCLMILAGAFELLVGYLWYVAAECATALLKPPLNSRVLKTRSSTFHGMGMLVLSIALAIGLAACQLLPSFEMFFFGSRSVELLKPLATIWSLHPGRLFEMLAPGFFGNAAQETPWTALLLPSIFGNHPFLVGIYVGVPCLSLAWVGLRLLPRRHSLFLLGMLIVTVVMSFGNETPIFEIVRENVPGVGLFRYPAKIFTLSMIPLSVLAAAGAAGVLESGERSRHFALSAAGTFCVLLLATGLAGFFYRDAVMGWIARGIVEEKLALGEATVWNGAMTGISRGLAGGLFFLVTILLLRRMPARLAMSFLVMMVALDLGLANRRLIATSPKDAYLARPEPLPPSDSLVESTGTARVGYSRPGLRHISHEPHRLALLDYRVATSYGSMVLGNDATLEVALRDRPERLLQLKSVRLVLEKTPGAAPFEVKVIQNSLPRASLLPRAAATIDESTVARALGSEEFDPHQEVILSDIPLEVLKWGQSDNSQASFRRVQMTVDRPTEVRIQVESPTAAYLLLTDTWYPGWEAQVNGKIVPIHRANLMFRVVQVAAGKSEVAFFYRPKSVRAGFQVSGLSLILFVWIAVRSRRRTDRHPARD